jgi:hypothetical protein
MHAYQNSNEKMYAAEKINLFTRLIFFCKLIKNKCLNSKKKL